MRSRELRPILYDCEVWGPAAMNLHKLKPNTTLEDKYDTLKFDKFQLRLLKQLLCVNSRKCRDVTTWRVAKRRYQGVENKPLICIAV